MTSVLENLEPKSLWRHFAALSAIPRASGKEAAARAYVHSAGFLTVIGPRRASAP